MFALTSRRPALQYLKHFLGLALLTSSLVSMAQTVGQVEFSRGAGVAQSSGQLPRTLGQGLPLREGDRLTTADDSNVIVKLNDGTRMTLRPNTEVIVQKYQYQEGASGNSVVLQLLRGGFRALTGLISKGAPDATQIQAANATILVRGTDFDARICGPECKAESSRFTEKPRPNTVQASAKLVSAQGEFNATDGLAAKRRLVDGASVYAGETVETGPGAKGVLVFRDDSRLSLGALTRFKVDSFVFDDKNPADGRFLISLLRGSMRALTGVIGKTNTRNVGFSTATATIGIRGTGLDLDCGPQEVTESCSFFTWLGTIEVTQVGQTTGQILQAGQGLYVSRTETRPLTAPTLDGLPRPDSVPVDILQLFSTGGVFADEEGLFVYVRDGHIEIVSAGGGSLHLGRGETGYARRDGQLGRPENTPAFIQFDSVPLPNSSNPMVLSLLSEIGRGSANLCR